MSEAGLEQKYIEEAFDTNWVVPLGPNVIGFEKDLEDLVNEIQNENEKLSKKVVALSSGTVAVHLRMHRLRQWCVRVCLQSWYVLACWAVCERRGCSIHCGYDKVGYCMLIRNRIASIDIVQKNVSMFYA